MEKVEKRFMFDTNALNRICADSGDEMLIYASKSEGYEYFFSEIQCLESCANIEKNTEGLDRSLIERNRAEFALKLLKIISKLQTKYVGQIANLRWNQWILDGTFRLLPDNETAAYDMFLDIVNDNDLQYYNDGMIAMTAIAYGCTLVTNDKRLFNKVNKHFADRAIKYEDFISRLKK